MYRPATLALRTARAARPSIKARAYATGADAAPQDFAAAREAVKAHAVGQCRIDELV
jgi:hypothetical protein